MTIPAANAATADVPPPGALGAAITANDAAAVKELLQRGADTEDCTGLVCASPLTKAAMEGYLDIMRLLLATDADINGTNVSGETPLIMAVSGRQPEAVTLLIEAGADLGVRAYGNGDTALDFAKKINAPDMVRLLTEAPALQQRLAEEKTQAGAEAHAAVVTQASQSDILALRRDNLRKLAARRKFRPQ